MSREDHADEQKNTHLVLWCSFWNVKCNIPKLWLFLRSISQCRNIQSVFYIASSICIDSQLFISFGDSFSVLSPFYASLAGIISSSVKWISLCSQLLFFFSYFLPPFKCVWEPPLPTCMIFFFSLSFSHSLYLKMTMMIMEMKLTMMIMKINKMIRIVMK